MNDNSPDLFQWLVGIVAAVVAAISGGSILHNKKRFEELPEKYVMKPDFLQVKQEIREDMQNVKKELLEGIRTIHARLDVMQERRGNPR